MEVYTALFDMNLNEIRTTDAVIIEKDTFDGFLNKQRIAFFGDGAEKCKDLLGTNPNASFLDNFQLSSKYMISIALEKFNNKIFEDTAYFEPYYLKDFIAGKPKVKGLQ
jgi:tRNA threonylcarbamoyladenosine biosynthesis protein TsaB